MPAVKGSHLTPAHKAKLSKFFKGRPNFKIIGRKHTPEELEKMSIAHLGKKFSPEAREKIRKSKLGSLNPNYAKHPSPETRAKLRASRTGDKNHQWGKPHTEETRAKISASLKEWFKHHRNPNLGRHHSEESHRRWFEANQVKPNKQEIRLQGILDTHFPGEWKFVGDGQLFVGGLCPDFTNVNGKKCLLELYGDFWHSDKVVKKKNWTRTELGRIMHYNSYGFKCLVIWERELKDEKALVARVRQWVRN